MSDFKLNGSPERKHTMADSKYAYIAVTAYSIELVSLTQEGRTETWAYDEIPTSIQNPVYMDVCIVCV